MHERQPPTVATIEQARRGIEVVRAGLAARRRGTWSVYAIRSVEIYPDDWVLYVITRRTSLPLSADMAASLSLETVYLSGRVRARLLPADLTSPSDGSDTVHAMEVHLVLLPRTGSDAAAPRDGASLVTGLIDAMDGPAVRLTLALSSPPLGWPR
jgi:hypothetical protein